METRKIGNKEVEIIPIRCIQKTRDKYEEWKKEVADETGRGVRVDGSQTGMIYTLSLDNFKNTLIANDVYDTASIVVYNFVKERDEIACRIKNGALNYIDVLDVNNAIKFQKPLLISAQDLEKLEAIDRELWRGIREVVFSMPPLPTPFFSFMESIPVPVKIYLPRKGMSYAMLEHMERNQGADLPIPRAYIKKWVLPQEENAKNQE